MKYAVFLDRGKQYKASEGQEIYLDRLESAGGKLEFGNVLLYVDGETVRIGQPTVPGAKVFAEVIGEEKGEKIRAAKYKAKSRYRKVRGHRSIYTRAKIEKINLNK